MIATGYALSSIGFAFTGLVKTLPALAVTVVIWSLGEMIFAPVGGAYITNLAPEHLRGRYHGMAVQMWSIGMVVGPTLGTWMFQRNPTALWIVCGVGGALGSMLMLVRPAAPLNCPADEGRLSSPRSSVPQASPPTRAQSL